MTVDDGRAAEGAEHLQRAALEVIGAARAFLDVAEEVVNDPDAVGEIVAGLGSLVELARAMGVDAMAGSGRAASAPPGSGSATAARPPSDRPGSTSHVEHIPVT
jgi:hypothetical protein